MKNFKLIFALVIVSSLYLVSCTSETQSADPTARLMEYRDSNVEPFASMTQESFTLLAESAVFDEKLNFRGLHGGMKQITEELGKDEFQWMIAKITNQISLETTFEEFQKIE